MDATAMQGKGTGLRNALACSRTHQYGSAIWVVATIRQAS